MSVADRSARYENALRFAERQVRNLVETHPDFFPIYTVGGKWRHEGELWTDWTGGFLAGMMWQFAGRTGDSGLSIDSRLPDENRSRQVRSEASHGSRNHGDTAISSPLSGGDSSPTNESRSYWRTQAERYSRLLEHRKHDRAVHDLGFIFLNTYRPWYQATGDESKQAILIEAGRTLALRFQEAGQYLCSFVKPESLFIDIMMNVPIIFYAAKATGDEDLYRIALTHCRTTRDTLVRPDGSTAHEGIFDPATGAFLEQTTHQGLRGDSAWARGLAWSLYGFSQSYELSGERELLDVAIRNAEYWLAHLPADKVPYWDFDTDLSQPAPWGAQRETSAGAIAASGLLHLAKQVDDPAQAERYRTTALEMLDALCDPEYLAIDTPGWEGILKHGVYHTAKNLGVDESVMWGEFFFVEGLSKSLSES